MTLRLRLTLLMAGTALVPVVFLGLAMRREMVQQLGARDAAHAAVLSGAMRADLDRRIAEIRERLVALGDELDGDPLLRRALTAVPGADRSALLAWAGFAAPRGGLAMLQLQDSAGRILSSAHFRQEFDRVDRGILDFLTRAPAHTGFLTAPTASGTLPVLATVHRREVAGQRFFLVGGQRADSLGGIVQGWQGELRVVLIADGTAPPGHVLDEMLFPQWVAPGTKGPPTARFALVRNPAPMRDLLRALNWWMVGVVGAALLAALGLAVLLARQVSTPLEELARVSATVDLEGPPVDFGHERDDAIGTLARHLGQMTDRLRGTASVLRQAERRAVTGDLARQVTHDIRNGLVPIRNVLRHLDEEAAAGPGELARVYGERRATLFASVTYLEDLARTYAQLSPDLEGGRCDLNEVVRATAAAVQTPGIMVQVDLVAPPPLVAAAEVIVRRIVDNLVANALEAMADAGGTLTLRTAVEGSPEPRARVTVSDTGRGMGRTELDRAFEDFQSTRPGGTGLGLTVVRRLVADLGGTLRAESAPGIGTSFLVEIPLA